MSQTWDIPIDTTDTIAAGRTQINDALATLRTLNSGGTAPTNTTPFMLWLDTSTTPDSLKMRNAADSAWVTILADVTSAGGGLLPLTGGTMTGNIAMSGTQKLTSLASGTASTDSVTWGQTNSRVLSSTVHLGTISATDEKYLFITHAVSTTITDVILSSELGVAADGANKWTFQVRDLTGALDLLSAVKDTSAAAITADTAYALGVNQNNSGIAAAKVLELQMTKTGAPNNLQELLVTVKFTVQTP